MPEDNVDTPTQLLPVARAADPETAPIPVFVDASGLRRRVLQRVAMGMFLTAAGYSLMVIWSLLGGPVSPDTLMPFSAPKPPASTVQPSQPSLVATAGVTAALSTSPAASSTTTHSASTPSVSPSPSASSSPSASVNGHRPTSAPSKSTKPGHGH